MIKIGLIVSKGSKKPNRWVDKKAHKEFVKELFRIKEENKL